ncbi:Poly (3-hydroxybutyrate) depolymerase [Paraburkholderia ribeironis]|uniref:Poly (3-hydroxybutyrate) depolymerase n=1 Tax=Paraburkholderia ribeironis TaxID=1247936 RepID=A0A1N7S8Q0_9BURK|nr:poly(3-hydroxybutyrate) depolymerase [Paraburkholderia ribeironis]SIT43789.1 Poly (3-hydroxybutyrate) depolymerase [Paraburkholderia ribeironis]
MKVILYICTIALSILSARSYGEAVSYPPLPALNIDISQTSVSGISSGGFMAVQLAVAYSSIIKGVGVVAAGPYYCSQNDLLIATTRCSCTIQPTSACEVSAGSTDVPKLVSRTKTLSANHMIDDVVGVTGQRIVTISGARDATVPTAVVTQLQQFYAALGVPTQSMKNIEIADAGHTMPTINYGVACAKSESPFIGKCDVDGAKEMLGWIYGPDPLVPPSAATRQGRFIRFDQSRYLPANRPSGFTWTTGMDTTGWLYVPSTCDAGAPCRLHVALHGCEQGQDYVPLDSRPGLFYGTTFVRHAGYTQWADNNRIVVLYPQAVSIAGLNPNGCWDWWGYTDSHFADQQGVQMRAIRNMIGQLTSGATH